MRGFTPTVSIGAGTARTTPGWAVWLVLSWASHPGRGPSPGLCSPRSAAQLRHRVLEHDLELGEGDLVDVERHLVGGRRGRDGALGREIQADALACRVNHAHHARER